MAENLLNKVMEMQQQGYQDDQIAMMLTDQGISPKDITDALNKSKIKAAVYQPEYGQDAAAYSENQLPAQTQQAPTVQPNYPEYVQGMSSETVSEITEQLISEKLGNVLKSISDVSVFKERTDKRISLIDDRLKKIEMLVDELRSSIIRKIGDFSQNVEDIKNEMSMVQDSFSKIVRPVVEERKAEKKSEKKLEKEERKPSKSEEEASFLESRLKI